MTLTPEQLAKSREEFKEEFKDWRGFLAEDEQGKFINKYTQRMWVGWVRRQGSLVVELPAMFHDSVSGYEADEMKAAIKSAGINYREKE